MYEILSRLSEFTSYIIVKSTLYGIVKEALSLNAFHLISRNKNQDLRSIIIYKVCLSLDYLN